MIMMSVFYVLYKTVSLIIPAILLIIDTDV